MRLCDADAIGFDLDHTLAKYNIPKLIPLVYNSVVKYLVEKKHYPKNLVEEPFDKYEDLCFRGLIFDTTRGNLLKISADGKIVRATHGTKPMCIDDIKKIYGDECKFEHFQTMYNHVNNIEHKWIILENYFDIPYGIAAARVIDVLDEKAGYCVGVYDIWKDVLEAVLYVYDPKHFGSDNGQFFAAMTKELEVRIHKVTKEILVWLKKIKGCNIITFMLTSSCFPYGRFIMDYILGSNWEDYFDLNLNFARKPSFFSKRNPFLKLQDGEETCEAIELETGNCYSQGNAELLTQFIAKKTGKKTPKIVYIGDSLRSDIFTSKKFMDWANIFVLDELRVEGCKEPDDTYPEERSMLTSQFWGSLFYENNPDTTGNHKRYPNTFWGRLTYTYADIVIPGLEYIADLSLDHEFSVFMGNEKTHGFYPAPPKSLVY